MFYKYSIYVRRSQQIIRLVVDGYDYNHFIVSLSYL